MPNFDAASGADYAEETQSAGGGRSARIAPVKLEDKKRVFARVLSSRFPGRPDSVITVDTHRFAPVTTKPTAKMVAKAKENSKEVKWPDTMWGVCPRDRIFKDGDGYEEGYGDCLIHTKYAGQKGGQYNKPLDKTDRHTYAVVVLQEARFDDKNVLISCEDMIESWTDPDGNEIKVPAIRYLAQSWRNIWSAATSAVAMAEREDILDEVFMFKREGTDYTVLLVQGKKALIDEAKRKVYEETLERMGFTLPGFITDHASRDHYERFWGTGPQDKADDDSSDVDGAAGTVAEPATAAGAEPDEAAQSRIDGFAAALKGQTKDAGAAEPGAASEAAEAGENAALVG